MSTIYSKRFLAVQNVTVSATAVVPTGKVWVLKCIDFLLGTASGTAGFQVAGCWIAFGTQATPPPGSSATVWQWRGHQVAYPGETLVLFINGGTWSGVASGYELTA
jgi:hypothetical protein